MTQTASLFFRKSHVGSVLTSNANVTIFEMDGVKLRALHSAHD